MDHCKIKINSLKIKDSYEEQEKNKEEGVVGF